MAMWEKLLTYSKDFSQKSFIHILGDIKDTFGKHLSDFDVLIVRNAYIHLQQEVPHCRRLKI